MIDEKFSKKNFEELGLNTSESRQLSDLLEAEVLSELDNVICLKMQEIIKKLNDMGHKLTLYEPSSPGDIAYRDDSNENQSYRCFLRLGVDTVISAGYSHLYDFEE